MVNLVLLLCLLGLCGYGCYGLSKLPESVAVVQKPEPVDAEDVHDNNTTSEEITETETTDAAENEATKITVE